MSDRLVTVASFYNAVEANLAKNQLVAAGLDAFLEGEETVSTIGYLANAFGGIKLQVREQDVEKAVAVLEEAAEETSSEDELQHESEESFDTQPLEELEQQQTTEPEEELTRREDNARRAFNGSVLGLLFCPIQFYDPSIFGTVSIPFVLGLLFYPIQFYVLWLLSKVYFSEEQLGRAYQRRAIVAALLNFPIWLLLGYMLLLLIRAANGQN